MPTYPDVQEPWYIHSPTELRKKNGERLVIGPGFTAEDVLRIAGPYRTTGQPPQAGQLALALNNPTPSKPKKKKRKRKKKPTPAYQQIRTLNPSDEGYRAPSSYRRKVRRKDD